MTVYSLFEHDSQGFAVPKINPASKWVQTQAGSSALVTIKLDGIQVRVEKGILKRPWPDPSAADGNWSPEYVECDADFPEDRPLLLAFTNAKVYHKVAKLPDGIYEAFGPQINGNPMGCTENFMCCISPMTTSALIVNRGQLQLRLGHGVDDKAIYDSIFAELKASPEIEGIVLLYEQSMTNPLHWASVTRKEMGLPWPVNVLVTA